ACAGRAFPVSTECPPRSVPNCSTPTWRSNAVSGSSASDFTLKSAQFRRERERSWRELEELVTRVERHGLSQLTAGEIARLPALYRSAVSSLSVATAISLDRNLLEYLNGLVGRAYLCVYGTKQPARQVIAGFFTHRFPQTVRRYLC